MSSATMKRKKRKYVRLSMLHGARNCTQIKSFATDKTAKMITPIARPFLANIIYQHEDAVNWYTTYFSRAQSSTDRLA